MALRAVALAFACALVLALALMLATRSRPALAAIAGGRAKSSISGHTLLQSRELWATINVCNAPDQPDFVGIRGSMPGNGRAHDTMYMLFRVQYLEPKTKRWTDTKNLVVPEFHAVGPANTARQAGKSFDLPPVAGEPPITYRGVVTFQWHRGAKVLTTASRITSAGRVSTSGADPARFSAATCVIG
jgi:hypothetical protein